MADSKERTVIVFEDTTVPNPHYSWALLLQSPIRCYDEASVGGLALRTFNVLHEYASGPQGSARCSRDTAQRFHDEPSWI